MMKILSIKFTILVLVMLLYSCGVGGSHQHDGHYYTMFHIFGIKFEEINIDIRGDDVTVDNSITGISKFKCRQYDDRIEYEENNGTTKVMYFLANGDLKFNDNITLVNVSEGKLKNKNDENNTSSQSKSDNKKNVKQSIEKDVSNQYALVKDIRYEYEHHDLVISLDYVQVKMTGEMNDFKIINENTTLRTFKINDNCKIENCLTDVKLNTHNIIDNRSDIISAGKNNRVVVCDVLNGELVSLKIGCYN